MSNPGGGGAANLALTWTALNPIAPFKAFGAPYNLPRVALDAMGLIHLDGLLALSAGSVANAQVFQLPAQFTPSAQLIAFVPEVNFNNSSFLFIIPTTGLVTCQQAALATNALALSSVAAFAK